MKKIEDLIERYGLGLLIIVIAVYLATRYLLLGEISYYLHTDEANAAYEALCRAKYGVSPGTSDMSLFVFISSLLMKLKGGLFSLKMFRLLNVAAGLVGLVFTYLTVGLVTGRKRFALLSAVLVASLPVYFISQRSGIGDWMFLAIVPAAYFFLLKAAGKSGRLFYLIAGILFAITAFTYNQAPVIVPVFVAGASVYLLMRKKSDPAGIIMICAPVAVLIAAMAVSGNVHLDISASNIGTNIMNISHLLWDDGHPYDVSSTFGTLYVFSIPVVIVGIVISVRKVISAFKSHAYDHIVLLWIFTVVCLIVGLMADEPDVRSINGIFFAVTLFLTEGLIWISDNVRAFFIIELATYSICLCVLGYYYRANFNSEVNNSTDHEEGLVVDKSVGEAVKEIIKTMPGKDIVVVTDDFGGRNLLIALYAGIHPSDYASFKEEDTFSVEDLSVAGDIDVSSDKNGNSVYIINLAEHQDMIDDLTEQGWGNVYLKEYTVCYMQ